MSSKSSYKALKSKVSNRGIPPDDFLRQMIEWGKIASAEIFAPNNTYDVYSMFVGVLGPWKGPESRRAAMLEIMRVLAGFESSWNWNEGVDKTNPKSNTPNTTEAGAWQVSADSMHFGKDLRDLVLKKVGTLDGNTFQKAMKTDHPLAMEYVARLLRHTINHHGPIKRRDVEPWLRKDAMAEFQALVGQPKKEVEPMEPLK